MNSEPNHALRLVFWELTARCNLACQHCRAEALDHFAAGELSTAELIKVAGDIRAAGDPIMVLTGGEPLVRKDFFEIAGACCGLFTRVALATNGTLVDDDLARRIKACGIKRVSVSLDGACAATHDAFRRIPGCYQETLRGFDALRRAGESLQVNVTVAKHNIAEVADILNLALERGAEAFHVFVLVPVGCGAELAPELRLSPAEMEEILKWLFDKALELKSRLHIKATCAPQYYRIMQEVARARKIAIRAEAHGMQALTRGCLAGSAVCFISRIGDVQPCGYLPVRVGNARERSFCEIWNEAEVFAALRDPGRLKGKCGVCGYRKICEGCRARAFVQTGDFLAEDPDCVYCPDGNYSAIQANN
ncbi:MAG: radical SAM protein [Lentisphaerae bacterium]|nr:radical SAM protein [Lentisphaerota bacterium]